MSTSGIRRFQGWLTNPRAIRDLVTAEVEMMLYDARDREPVDFYVWDFGSTRDMLWEVARTLAAQAPEVSTDPVMVKAREVAPEMIRTEWCTDRRVWCVCEAVVAEMSTVEVFAVYAEVGMDNPKLGLDIGTFRKLTAVDIARACCLAFAYRVFLAAADDDLKEE